jgi:Type VI secretion system/phage-baseplate injector OB domain
VNEFSGLRRAIVKSTNDPAQRGRILVAIPASSAEQMWAVLCVPSGRRAEVFSPEVGDEVIVGFLDGDVRSPICLGSLWSPQSPPSSRADRERG